MNAKTQKPLSLAVLAESMFAEKYWKSLSERVARLRELYPVTGDDAVDAEPYVLTELMPTRLSRSDIVRLDDELKAASVAAEGR